MSPYKIKFRVYVSGGGCETETFLDNYEDICEYINTNIHSGFIMVEAVIVGPRSIIPAFTGNKEDAVLCKTKILETYK